MSERNTFKPEKWFKNYQTFQGFLSRIGGSGKNKKSSKKETEKVSKTRNDELSVLKRQLSLLQNTIARQNREIEVLRNSRGPAREQSSRVSQASHPTPGTSRDIQGNFGKFEINE